MGTEIGSRDMFSHSGYAVRIAGRHGASRGVDRTALELLVPADVAEESGVYRTAAARRAITSGSRSSSRTNTIVSAPASPYRATASWAPSMPTSRSQSCTCRSIVLEPRRPSRRCLSCANRSARHDKGDSALPARAHAFSSTHSAVLGGTERLRPAIQLEDPVIRDATPRRHSASTHSQEAIGPRRHRFHQGRRATESFTLLCRSAFSFRS
jgi:hypothetical protein